MAHQHGPWTIQSSREVYSDPWVTLSRDEVTRPDGAPGSYVVVNLKPGVSVLPLDAGGNVHLTQEFHYGVGRETIEVVSGGCEPDEDPQQTAERELLEELGIVATDWTPLGVCDPFTANVVSPTRLYLARSLTVGEQALEGTEVIQRVTVPFAQARDWAMDGTISHAPSALLILKAWLHCYAEDDTRPNLDNP